MPEGEREKLQELQKQNQIKADFAAELEKLKAQRALDPPRPQTRSAEEQKEHLKKVQKRRERMNPALKYKFMQGPPEQTDKMETTSRAQT